MLTIKHFTDFFRAVHGMEPFPWQTRLTDAFLAGAPPSTIDAPTSAGKTAILDAAVFALAAGARFPRRIVHIVDRRLVVDDAYRRAEKIRLAVERGESETPNSILHEVYEGLMARGGAKPLETTLLRGGLYQEDNLARHPAQPLIVCSTVDQVGSRILHQGYGISPYLRSIHAGLLANDSLIVLDEAHCSEPFRQTIESIAKYRSIGTVGAQSPFAFIAMTATPGDGTGAFRINMEDRNHPVLSKRLKAKKRIEFVEAAKPKDEGLAATIVERAYGAAKPGSTILVVVNRVSLARKIAQRLSDGRKDSRSPLNIEEPLLLTGRSRPAERDGLLAAVAPRVFAGRDRKAFGNALPLIVVATQCVEVGADLDVDSLITEACPIDSLRQRLGRLDRLGELGDTVVQIVAPHEFVAGEKGNEYIDPVYGEPVKNAWQSLKALHEDKGGLDGGVEAFTAALGIFSVAILSSMRAPSLDAPLMFPAYCDLWAQTSPQPAAVPEPSLFLHGIQRAEAEVQIVWRADLPEDRPETWAEILSLCPPASGELLRLPLARAKAWLENSLPEAQGGSDIEGEAGTREGRKPSGKSLQRTFLRWAGTETVLPENDPRSIRPGDTLVFPASAGGCDRWGWNPECTSAVADIATVARNAGRRPPVLRLHPSLTQGLPEELLALPTTQDDETTATIVELFKTALGAMQISAVVDPELKAILAELSTAKRLAIEPHPSGTGWVLARERKAEDPRDEITAEDEGSSRGAAIVPLNRHLSDVAATVDDISANLGFAGELRDALVLAARLHDLGKADPRFQALLWGGDRLKALKNGLIAKSPRIKNGCAARFDLRREAGYPKGGRHELLSLAFAARSAEVASSKVDRDLVLHLIASHHGRCRPFAPVIEDDSIRAVNVIFGDEHLVAPSDGSIEGLRPSHIANGIADRYWRLVRKYGWWGLSYLEACLRLADHRASEMEEKEAAV